MTPIFRSRSYRKSVLSRPEFHDEAKAFEHIESVLWPAGPVCPKCGNMDKHYKLNGVRTKPSVKNPNGVERHGLYKCAACKAQFTVRMGTVFEESHLPLHKWLQAIHLMCASEKGISAHQMHRILEVKYDTAWFLCHRIREAMRSGDLRPWVVPARSLKPMKPISDAWKASPFALAAVPTRIRL